MKDEEALALRAKISNAVATGSLKRPRRKGWEPPTLDDFAHGSVLAFDQTVTKTGWAVVERDRDGLAIAAAGLIQPPPTPEGVQGFEETLRRALYMLKMLGGTVMVSGRSVQAIVHEMPAVAGHRIESSLLAALGVRHAADEMAWATPVEMISKQAMAARLLHPDRRDKKRYVTEMVEDLVPADRRHASRWNQDVHDAVALGLTWLHMKKEQG